MDVTIFLGAGIAAELALALVKLRYSRRGLVCWTVAAVVLLMCCGVYFAKAVAVTLDVNAAVRCAAGAAVLAAVAVLLELVSPSRRRLRELRRRNRHSRTDDAAEPAEPGIAARGENSLNLVLALAAGILCGAGFLMMRLGEGDTGAALLLFPAAAALRQTAYFLRRDREDSAALNSPENQRRRLVEKVAGERFRL